MSNILKSKIGLIIFSVIALIFIPLFKSNFNATVTINKWRQLNWDDFQGFVKPFTGWGAGISSTVYLEYDSTTEKYVAYAAMNNQLSWKKRSSEGSNYLLNHEQYHFNITEYFTRKLNLIIEKEKLENESDILSKLGNIRSELSEFQDKYDKQSDHSINGSVQRKWEFKIDSLLQGFMQDLGRVTDYYSGGRVLMPDENNFIDGIVNSKAAFRVFQLNKYDMQLGMASFQLTSLPVQSLTESTKTFYLNDSLEIKSFEIDSSKYSYRVIVEAFDSVDLETTIDLWVYHDDYLYKITANYPEYNGESSGYKSIANSFINSFQIIKTDNYWEDKFLASASEIISTSIIPLNNSKSVGGKLSKCAIYGQPNQNGFYGRPIFREDGALLIPYNPIEHADSLISEVMLIYQKKWYSYEQKSEDIILFIPQEDIIDDVISINFGYLLKQDSVNECFTFHRQFIEINRRIAE